MTYGLEPTRMKIRAVFAEYNAKGLAVSAKDFEDFPYKRRHMDLYWDGDGFIYTDNKVKFIVKPNYEIKIKTEREGKKHETVKRVCLVTAGKVRNKNDFKNKRYERI